MPFWTKTQGSCTLKAEEPSGKKLNKMSKSWLMKRGLLCFHPVQLSEYSE